MVEFLSDVVLGYQLRKKLKSFDLQPKKSVRAFKTMAVILPEDLEVDIAVFEVLAESLNLTSSKITFVEFSKKKLEERTTDERNRIFCSRKDISLSGRFTSEMRDFFNTKFDLVVNYFSVKAIFPELISMNCSASLRLGFSQANHQINDVILDIDPLETDLFLSESTNYLKAFLK